MTKPADYQVVANALTINIAIVQALSGFTPTKLTLEEPS